jgi:hypothetical protein
MPFNDKIPWPSIFLVGLLSHLPKIRHPYKSVTNSKYCSSIIEIIVENMGLKMYLLCGTQ